MKLVTIIGARPQFVKASVISRAIKAFNQQSESDIDEILIHTGQHFDNNMSQLFFDQLGIPAPRENLNIHGGNHGEMTGKMLIELEKCMLHYKPDLVLVYGDTNSTLAGALTAAKLHIPVAHVEAGLRSFNKEMPEEINRIMTDHVSDYLFCPTQTAMENLAKENLGENAILSGDVMYDAFLYAQQVTSARPESQIELGQQRPIVLATVHRAENTDSPQRLKEILSALNELAMKVQIMLPLHPRTRAKVKSYNLSHLLSNILVTEPLGYFQVVHLLTRCQCVITDSGGLQKEAYFAHKPCITLREETEWKETIESGWNSLANITEREIILQHRQLKKPETWHPFYGSGKSGESIVQVLSARLLM